MAKKVTGYIKLQIPAGKATPAPPVGPALGQHGVNIVQFTKEFNARTADQGDLIIPQRRPEGGEKIPQQNKHSFTRSTAQTPFYHRNAGHATKYRNFTQDLRDFSLFYAKRPFQKRKSAV